MGQTQKERSMKAKDYIKQLEAANYCHGAISNVVLSLMDEACALIKSRNCQSNSAIISVLKEQDSKWQAMCRLTPRLKPEGFAIVFKAAMPELYAKARDEVFGSRYQNA